MSTITRRQFLASTSFAAGAAALSGRFALAQSAVATAPAKAIHGTDMVTLGKSGIRTSVLGIGTGTRGGREQRGLGEDGFVRLAREAFDRGVRYMDTADGYRMHGFVKAALKQLPRDEIFLQTKTRARNREDAEKDIERFRRELDVETLDTVLIHCMTKDEWPGDMRPVIDALVAAKQKGYVRAIGVSCHTLDALVDATQCPEMDVHLVRINPFQSHMDDTPQRVAQQIAKMQEDGRGVIGMKIYGEDGYNGRQQRLDSLRYVLGLGTVQAFTIGFSNVQQIDETLQLIEEATA